MSRSFTLKPLQDLSRSRLDDATNELGKLISREQEGARKLELLEEYRAEYEARFRDAMNNGIGVDAMRNYSAFMTRIDAAIETQRAQLGQSKQHTAVGKQQWIDQRNRVKAFDTLAERHHNTEQRRQQKLEQRQSDEHAANRHRRAGDNEAEDDPSESH